MIPGAIAVLSIVINNTSAICSNSERDIKISYYMIGIAKQNIELVIFTARNQEGILESTKKLRWISEVLTFRELHRKCSN